MTNGAAIALIVTNNMQETVAARIDPASTVLRGPVSPCTVIAMVPHAPPIASAREAPTPESGIAASTNGKKPFHERNKTIQTVTPSSNPARPVRVMRQGVGQNDHCRRNCKHPQQLGNACET